MVKNALLSSLNPARFDSIFEDNPTLSLVKATTAIFLVLVALSISAGLSAFIFT